MLQAAISFVGARLMISSNSTRAFAGSSPGLRRFQVVASPYSDCRWSSELPLVAAAAAPNRSIARSNSLRRYSFHPASMAAWGGAASWVFAQPHVKATAAKQMTYRIGSGTLQSRITKREQKGIATHRARAMLSAGRSCCRAIDCRRHGRRRAAGRESLPGPRTVRGPDDALLHGL